jgi:mRNA interferase MazF
MRRGDVVTVADSGTDSTGKPRPAVIMQSDTFLSGATVTVLPITSDQGGMAYLRVPLSESPDLTLAKPSYVVVERISAVRRKRIGKIIGRLSDAEMQILEARLTVFLGLG